MADPLDTDDEYWGLCLQEIDKVERAAVQLKAANQQSAAARHTTNGSGQVAQRQAPSQQISQPQQRVHFQQQRPPQHLNPQHPQNQNRDQNQNSPVNVQHVQQRPMLIQPVVSTRPPYQQVPAGRWQAPAGGRPNAFAGQSVAAGQNSAMGQNAAVEQTAAPGQNGSMGQSTLMQHNTLAGQNTVAGQRAEVGQNTAPRQPLQPVQAPQSVPLPGGPLQAKPSMPASLSSGPPVHPPPATDRMQQEVWRMSEELRQQTEAMVLKDGCISLLRDRLRTAEADAFELRKRSAGLSASSQQSTTRHTSDMQREIERLQGQLLFKEQEVLEAKRAKAEKDLKIKEAQEASQRLEAELRALQQHRSSPGSAGKRRRESDTESPKRPLALNQQLNQLTSESGAVPSRSPKALFKSPASGRNSERPVQPGVQRQSQESAPVDRAPASNAVMPEVTPAATSAMTSSAVGHTADGGVANGLTEARTSGKPSDSKSNEPEKRPLRTLERLETVGVRLREAESGACFVQKLFAVCAGDLYTLVSGKPGSEEGKGKRDAPSFMQALAEARGGPMPMEVDVAEEREGFRDALAKVMNGHKPAVALFSPLRAALDSKEAATVYSALRVLRPLMRLDSAARSVVLGSAAAPPLEANWIPFRSSNSPIGANHGAEQLRPSSSSIHSSISSEPRLSSRVKIGPASKAHSNGAPTAERHIAGKGKAPIDPNVRTSNTDRDSDSARRTGSGNSAGVSGRDGSPIDRGFFDRLLELAVENEQPRAQFEAASTLALLVVHVPADRRTDFGFLLTDGRLVRLLGPGSLPPVQGVALHIVHLLCESRPLVESMFSSRSGDFLEKWQETGGASVTGKRSEAGASTSAQVRASETGDMSVAVTALVSAVAACLWPETKDLVLKQSAVQLLSFIYGLSEQSAALLVSLGRNGSKVRERHPQVDLRKAIEAGKDAEAKHVPDDVDNNEPSIAARLLNVLDEELGREEEQPDSSTDERTALLSEACTFLSRLVLQGRHADEALSPIVTSSHKTRLAISVTTRLIKLSRDASEKVSRESAELAKGLQRRVLESMPVQGDETGFM